MKLFSLLMVLALIAGAAVAEDLQQKARQYAASTGQSYDECLNALQVGMWCKANPQGGILYGKTYDAKATAEILANATRLLTEPKKPEPPDANYLRQQQQAKQYAVATGRAYEQCLWAVVTADWCAAHPQGSVVNGVTYDAAGTAQQMALAMQVLGIRPAAAPAAGGVIESSIVGTFKGFEQGRIFKLQNGQIWEQTEYEHTYEYEYSPEVLIYPSQGRMMMRVEGADDPVEVKQLK